MCLVLIRPKELTYQRYEGRTKGIKVKAESPLTAREVELFRVDPQSILPDPEPDSA